jgi:hypothetical protein
VSSATKPLMARALVLSEGDVTFGIVALDVLLVPDDVATEVRAASGLSDAWIIATHTHSSFGGYDHRSVAQLAGTGRFRADARKAVVDAAVDALRAAASSVRPVTVNESHLYVPGVSSPRSGEASDQNVLRLDFGDVSTVFLLAAHPTLVPRPATALDPDYPAQLEGLVLQSSGGNAVAAGDIAAKISTAEALELGLEETSLRSWRVEFTPPPPDASRLVPRLFAMPGHNFLCASAPATAEVGLLKIGPLTLAAIPAEVTYGSAKALGVPLVSLANGYLGYVEPADVVDRGEGEAKRQYYDRTLLDTIRAALQVAR